MRRIATFLASASMALALPAVAQDADSGAADPASAPDEEEAEPIVVEGDIVQEGAYDSISSIVVTATRIRQGGAQDIKHFRSVSFDDTDGLPDLDGLTIEGLMGEHDLALPPGAECRQLFCVNARTMAADIPALPGADLFLGLGFDSGVDAQAYRDEPLSIVAVVDRSGSMSGAPIARVKESLKGVLGELRDGDRLGIVIYGSSTLVHLPVVDVAGSRDAILAAIDSIAIDGSTYMEAGMKLGYATAFEELEHSRGKTRMMLFTDENPNVGNTSAEGFMGLARAGAKRGVGLTTIGVGGHFRPALASQIASVEGGNLFFVPSAKEAASLMKSEFRNMVSPVAHDIAIAIDPGDGWRVGEVFGVPEDIMARSADGTVTVKIGSAFLSSNGGGIFATLEKRDRQAGAVPATVSIAYTDALDDARKSDSLAASPASQDRPEALRRAQLLVDQYLTLTDALASAERPSQTAGAAKRLDALASRISASGLAGMDSELELVTGLAAKTRTFAQTLAANPDAFKPRTVLGTWKVRKTRGVDDLRPGDIVEITDDMEFITTTRYGTSREDDIYQDYRINERRILIEDDDYRGRDLDLRYAKRGKRLRLFDVIRGVEIVMEPHEAI